jgi:hypothetical protein
VHVRGYRRGRGPARSIAGDGFYCVLSRHVWAKALLLLRATARGVQMRCLWTHHADPALRATFFHPSPRSQTPFFLPFLSAHRPVRLRKDAAFTWNEPFIQPYLFPSLTL